MSISFDDDQLHHLLDLFLAGEASAAQAQQVRAWLAEHPDHAKILEDVRLIRRVVGERPPESSVDAAWQRTIDELQLPGHRPREQVVPIPLTPRVSVVRRRRFSPTLAAAATAVAILGGAWLWQGYEQTTPAAPQWHEVVTQNAQRANVRLSDGTWVTLAPGSRMRYGSDFGNQHRDVYLDGEAYFDVVHDETRSFRVHTKGGIAEDLGTAFVVRKHAGQDAMEVVVKEGLVALNSVQLNPGDLGRVDTAGAVTIQHNVDVDRHLAWMRGALVFDGTPLREVVSALERWYDVNIDATDADLARPLTATFRNEPLTQVLERIALTLDLRIEERGGSVTISPNRF